MGGHDHVAPALTNLAQQVQELPETLRDVCVALSVPCVFDALVAHLAAHVIDCKLLRPIRRVDNKGSVAHIREVSDPFKLVDNHLP